MPGCARHQALTDCTLASRTMTLKSSNWKPPANTLEYARATASSSMPATMRSRRPGGSEAAMSMSTWRSSATEQALEQVLALLDRHLLRLGRDVDRRRGVGRRRRCGGCRGHGRRSLAHPRAAARERGLDRRHRAAEVAVLLRRRRAEVAPGALSHEQCATIPARHAAAGQHVERLLLLGLLAHPRAD